MDKFLEIHFMLYDEKFECSFRKGQKMQFNHDYYEKRGFSEKEERRQIEARLSDFIENFNLIFNRSKENIIQKILTE